MWCDAKALIHSVNPSLPQSWNEISAIGRTDVKAEFQQVENALEKMFLASIAHLLPSDIQISNGQQQELALNFSAAYYSALSGKCWPERESHIMIVLFIQQGNLGQQTDHPVSEKSQVLPDKIIWIHSSISNQHQSCQLDVELIKKALIQNTKQNYYLVKCYLILLLGYIIITYKTHIHKLFQLQSEKCTHSLKMPEQPVVTDGHSTG